jgi:hypothetical protein
LGLIPNEYQMKVFYESVAAARGFHQDKPNDEKLAETAMLNFNERHLQECATGIGLGGNIRLNHVKAFLREKALDMQRAQIGSISISTTTFCYLCVCRSTQKGANCSIDQAANCRLLEAIESSDQEHKV